MQVSMHIISIGCVSINTCINKKASCSFPAKRRLLTEIIWSVRKILRSRTHLDRGCIMMLQGSWMYRTVNNCLRTNEGLFVSSVQLKNGLGFRDWFRQCLNRSKTYDRIHCIIGTMYCIIGLYHNAAIGAKAIIYGLIHPRHPIYPRPKLSACALVPVRQGPPRGSTFFGGSNRVFGIF